MRLNKVKAADIEALPPLEPSELVVIPPDPENFRVPSPSKVKRIVPDGTREGRMTPALRAIAQRYTEMAIYRLARLMDHPDPRVAMEACEKILNRGHGKPIQPLAGSDGQGPLKVELVWGAPQSSHDG